MIKQDKAPLLYIVLSASLFGISPPLSKLLINDIPPIALAGLLYLGAFAGLSLYTTVISNKKTDGNNASKLDRKDYIWLSGAVLSGGILAPILMLMGLNLISGFSASLLLNLEGLATAVIAVFIFKENSGKHLWLALLCMTAAGALLTWDPSQSKFSIEGPLLIILAMVCWGTDNNLTCKISDKDPIQIAKIKGFVSGIISLSLALILGKKILLNETIFYALLLGSFSYGISLVFFIKALKGLGSSRTGLFFNLGPFIGAIASLIILKEWIGWLMFPAAGLMALGVWLISNEKHSHEHEHKTIIHTHSHKHNDMHHLHEHSGTYTEPHSHEHKHPELIHSHVHWPDTHHRHEH
jgi:drug/metabolite transporter (DMT)-like permease